jgi:hypothetical protein
VLCTLGMLETSMPALDPKNKCLYSHRSTAIVVSMLAVVTTIMGATTSHDYYISAILFWVASGLLWWSRTDTIEKDLDT